MNFPFFLRWINLSSIPLHHRRNLSIVTNFVLFSIRFCFSYSYLQWNNLLTKEEITELIKIYDQFLDGTLDVKKHRYDLGSAVAPKLEGKENITQIMWPSDILPSLRDHPMRQRALDLVRKLYSDDTFDVSTVFVLTKVGYGGLKH